MKFGTFSIVVGTSACNAGCPWCVSKMTETEAPESTNVNWARFDIACRLAEKANVSTALLTGKGEPMLYPHLITEYLKGLQYRFPLVELQTNGTLIEKHLEALKLWAEKGLTLVCLSIAHYRSNINRMMMRIKDEDYVIWEAVDAIHDAGLAVRFNCTMMRHGIWQYSDVAALAKLCKDAGVEQLTIRSVERPECPIDSEVARFVDEHRLPRINDYLRHWLDNSATKLLTLPHGAIVYDLNGQNICLSNCLTSTTNPEDIRQLTFFPDGRIGYDWKYPGARVL
jgi:molybdenum cofactor biosynthesis enzyme MoaA